MPNAYGQILLQQIKEQRQQRLRQRAEERGLPPPPDEPVGPSPNTSLVTATGNRTSQKDLSNSGLSSAYNVAFSAAGSSEQTLATEGTREACCPEARAAAAGVPAPRQPMLPDAEAATAIQSLLSLAPLLTRQPPQATAPLGVLPAACVQSVVPATLLGQQPLLVQPAAVVPSTLFPSNPQQALQQTQQFHGIQQPAAPIPVVGGST
ncbi:hypothetical protein ACSSS7_003262 [Eimeria intestinalis]